MKAASPNHQHFTTMKTIYFPSIGFPVERVLADSGQVRTAMAERSGDTAVPEESPKAAWRFASRRSPKLVAAALGFLASIAAADAQVSLTLNSSVTPQPPGCAFTVSGTIQNDSGATVFLNGLSLSAQDETLVLDSTPFGLNAPALLDAGASFTGPLFSVQSSAGGRYEVAVTLIGGASIDAGDILADVTQVIADAFAETLPPSPVRPSSARLRALASTGCDTGATRFRYGTSAGAMDQLTPAVTPPIDGSEITADLMGLVPLVTYFAQAFTTTSAGEAAGEIVSFTTPENQLPAAPTIALLRAKDHTAKVLVTDVLAQATDPDGESMTLTSVESPTQEGGTTSIAEGWVNYDPPMGFVGLDRFDYTVLDAAGGSATGEIIVLVADDPDLPALNRLSLTLNTGGSATLRFAGVRNVTYLLQATSSLTPPIVWEDIGSQMPGPDGTMEFNDPNASGSSMRIYRTIVQP